MQPNITGLECPKELRLAYPSEWRSWKMMFARIMYETLPDFQYYGGKGICVDPSWKDFEVFLEALGEKPTPKELYSLARKDKDGDYIKTNCFWGTASERCPPDKSRTHCRRGHPLIETNLLPYWQERGIRKCRLCFNEDTRIRRAAKKKQASQSPEPVAA